MSNIDLQREMIEFSRERSIFTSMLCRFELEQIHPSECNFSKYLPLNDRVTPNDLDRFLINVVENDENVFVEGTHPNRVFWPRNRESGKVLKFQTANLTIPFVPNSLEELSQARQSLSSLVWTDDIDRCALFLLQHGPQFVLDQTFGKTLELCSFLVQNKQV